MSHIVELLFATYTFFIKIFLVMSSPSPEEKGRIAQQRGVDIMFI